MTVERIEYRDDKGLIQTGDLQQNLQQICTFMLLLGYGCASVSIISSYLTSIKHLFTITYKLRFRTVDPKVVSSSLIGLAFVSVRLSSGCA